MPSTEKRLTSGAGPLPTIPAWSEAQYTARRDRIGRKGSERMQGRLTYQEILRTLGTLLDQSGSATARITLSLESAEVQAPSWPWQHTWSRDALYLESDRQRSWRSQP